jgi:hypothetical protein
LAHDVRASGERPDRGWFGLLIVFGEGACGTLKQAMRNRTTEQLHYVATHLPLCGADVKTALEPIRHKDTSMPIHAYLMSQRAIGVNSPLDLGG